MGDNDRHKGIDKMVASNLRSKLIFGHRPGLSWFVFTLEIIALALIVIGVGLAAGVYIAGQWRIFRRMPRQYEEPMEWQEQRRTTIQADFITTKENDK